MLLSFDFVVKISPSDRISDSDLLPPRPEALHTSMPPHLVLASTSPFRRDLLGRLNVPFDTAAPDVDESPLLDEPPTQTALRLSESKARAVADAFPGALIIGSDQVAHLNGLTFGKPGTHSRATEQLRNLSGQTVDFVTGICLLNTSSGAARSRTVTTRVTFRELNDDLIERYLKAEKPYNCAGSAKSEGLGIVLIAKMECTDPTALIGLPLIALCDLLEKENIWPV